MEKPDIKINSGEFKSFVKQESTDDGLMLMHISFYSDIPKIPSGISVRFTLPCADVYSLWAPLSETRNVLVPEGFISTVKSDIAHGAPIAMLVSKSGKNKATVALSDAVTASNIKIRVLESEMAFSVIVNLFTEAIEEITDFVVMLRIDLRDIRYEDALCDAEKWWGGFYGAANVPETSRMPMFSTWYNFHQNISDRELLKQCQVAVNYGMKTIIIDDGWQTEENGGGYAYCGDWQVAGSKIKDMKKLVDDIHKIGMKIMLWYSVPFIGKYAQNFSRFKGKFLNKAEQFGILDPRFRECREFIVSVYEKAVTDWELDGLKLDFIDQFRFTEYSSEEYGLMECVSLEKGVELLLDEINTALKSANPDFMIEFRQKYIGPAARKVGNMLRVIDCPYSSEQNKTDIINLRLLSGKTAVHSDMIMWREDECVESAALQVIATIYGVPQISVKLDTLPAEQAKMLLFYLDFWIKNRKILLDGKLSALNPESSYSLIKSELDGSGIITAYTRNDIDLRGLRYGSIINATGEESLIICTEAPVTCEIYDCMGNRIDNIAEICGISRISVPKSGLINFHAC